MAWAFRHRFGIWGFLVAVAFVPGIMSAAHAGRWPIVAAGVPLLSKNEVRLPQIVQIALAMGIAWAFASVVITPDRLGAIQQLFFMVVLAGVMVTASQFENLDDAMVGLCCGIGVSSAIGFLNWNGHPLVDRATALPAGLFYNSEVFAELAAPLFVWAVVRRKWPLVVATVVPLFVSESRISIAAVAVALVYAFPPKTKIQIAVFAIAALAVSGTMLYLFDVKFGSAALRITIWLSTIMAITPLGHGIGWFHVAHPAEEFAHSDVLQLTVELGVGALCFAVIPIWAFLRSGGHDAERAAFIVICIELLVSFPLQVPASAFLSALLAGYLVSRGDTLRDYGFGRGVQDGADRKRPAAITASTYRRGEFGAGLVSVRSAIA